MLVYIRSTAFVIVVTQKLALQQSKNVTAKCTENLSPPSCILYLLALNLQSIGKFFKSRFKEISSLFIYISHTLLHRQTHRRVYPPGFIIMIFLNINFFINYVNQKCDYNYFLQFFREADVQWKFFRYGYL